MNITRRGFNKAALASVATLATPAYIGRALGAMPKAEVKDHLVAYVGTGLQTTLADKLTQPFSDYMQKKYGVAVQVQTVAGQTPAAWVRFQTEWPNPSGDVYQFYNENIQEGIPKGYFLPLKDAYTDEEWALFDPDALKALGTGDYAAPADVSASVLVVQNSVKDKIDTWGVLGDPKYNHRVTFDSALAVGSGYNMVAAAALTIGNDWNTWFKNGKLDEQAAMPAFKEAAKWASNALTLTEGSGSITPLLRRQESLISAWWWHNGQQEVERGTPVHMVYPKEGSPAAVNAGPVVSSKTTNPVAALEWVKFVHSDVSMQMAISLKEYNRMPRKGETPNKAWQEFMQAGKIVWVNDFRETTIGKTYNQQILDLYNRVVIQGG